MSHRQSKAFTRWVLAAAVAGPAVSLCCGSAWGQYRVSSTDGGARDANNRIGSGGSNSGGPTRFGSEVTQNMIVNGNVTNFKSFRGPTGSTDARAFRGATADFSSDRFIRDSSGGFDRLGPGQQFNPAPYYGDSRAVAAPTGYVPTKITGTTTTTGNSQALFANSQLPSAANLQAANTGEGFTPQTNGSSSLFNSSSLRGQTGSSYLTMSPLGGIRPRDSNGTAADNNDGGTIYEVRGSEVVPILVNREQFRTDQQVVDSIRSELANTPKPTNADITPDANKPTSGAQPGSQAGAQLLGAPAESPINTAIGGNSLAVSSNLETGAIDSRLGSNPSLRRGLVPAGQQSAVINDLQRRMQELNGRSTAEAQAIPGKTNISENRQAKPDAGKKDAGNTQPGGVAQPGQPQPGQPLPGQTVPGQGLPGQPGQPGSTGIRGVPDQSPPADEPTGQPGAAAQPGGTAQPAPDAGRQLQAETVKSLATGVQSKALARALTDAEARMKEGKYADALHEYDLAEEAAPNNGLIVMGRANAELGAGSYRSAAAHLRDAYQLEPSLMIGQFDVKSMVGDSRIESAMKDLQKLAQDEPKESVAPLLLAYLAHNSGQATEASNYLTQVETRKGSPDPLVKQLRRYWGDSSAVPSLNK